MTPGHLGAFQEVLDEGWWEITGSDDVLIHFHIIIIIIRLIFSPFRYDGFTFFQHRLLPCGNLVFLTVTNPLPMFSRLYLCSYVKIALMASKCLSLQMITPPHANSSAKENSLHGSFTTYLGLASKLCASLNCVQIKPDF